MILNYFYMVNNIAVKLVECFSIIKVLLASKEEQSSLKQK